MPKLEFFYDVSSPWTYLGFVSIQSLAGRYEVDILWRPILVGGVFNQVNQAVYATRSNPPVPRKAEYMGKDLQDWATYQGLTINFPPKCGHPINSVKCMRAALWLLSAGNPHFLAFNTTAFQALWRDGLDLSKDEVLAAIAGQIGVPAVDLLASTSDPKIKDALRLNTDELIRRNGFGSPTIFVNDTDMYFGNDRMQLIEAALRRAN
jgi:2-hydroxychromene-2-carboxylate isomerase